MTTLIPNAQASGVEAYEDMFKEITKKLYGEEASHSLPMAHLAPAAAIQDVERSFTSLLTDRNVASMHDFDHAVGIDNVASLKNDDHLTAFGLALMQNGFPTPNAILNSHTFQHINKQTQANSSTNNQSSSPGNINSAQTQNASESVAEKCLPQHTGELNTWNSKSDNYHMQKLFKSKKDGSSNSPASNESLKSNGLGSNNANQTLNGNGQSTMSKRYNCTSCPYSTDRRDLFTRHENIHKEDKPFHCYVCLKQFNRADHVKKHFLRMHRGLSYDIGRTKRVPQAKLKKPSSVSTFYQSNSLHQVSSLNIPTTYQSTIPSQHQMDETPQTSIIDQTNQHLSGAFHTSTSNTLNHPSQSQMNVKVEKRLEKSAKKCDKRFVCCYCSWSGNDNWGLKRHLNTHTKPFVCVLCDYKAARSERLATHVFKVHSKKVCTKCNYLAENQTEFEAHVNEAHDSRTQRTSQVTNLDSRSSNNTLKNLNNCFNGASSFSSLQGTSSNQPFGWRSLTSGTVTTSSSVSKSNGSSSSSTNQKRGAERLFQYFEADDSDPEDYARQLQMAAISRNTASVAQDFHNAGGGFNKIETIANNQMSENALNRTNNCNHIDYSNALAIEFFRSNNYNMNNNSDSNSVNVRQKSDVKQNISPPANDKWNVVRRLRKVNGREKENSLAVFSHDANYRQHYC